MYGLAVVDREEAHTYCYYYLKNDYFSHLNGQGNKTILSAPGKTLHLNAVLTHGIRTESVIAPRSVVRFFDERPPETQRPRYRYYGRQP
jgi:hypothetical protein